MQQVHVEDRQSVLERLRHEHRALERRVQDLESHLALTADEEVELRRLKKLKLSAKDRILAMGG